MILSVDMHVRIPSPLFPKCCETREDKGVSYDIGQNSSIFWRLRRAVAKQGGLTWISTDPGLAEEAALAAEAGQFATLRFLTAFG